MQRTANAQWKGGLKDGKGTISTASGTLSNTQYSFGTRFESGKGTNPEELIAAAHASCFSMMLAKLLGEQGATAKRISTRATLTMRVDSSGAKITKVHLATEISADGLTNEKLQQSAANA